MCRNPKLKMATTVVVTVIAIVLIALFLAPFLFWGLTTPKCYAIKMEISQLSMSLERYRQAIGAYPPDFSTGYVASAIDEHLAIAFPERNKDQDTPGGIENLSPETALYFWLKGFSSDPLRPLTGEGQRDPFYDFCNVPADGRYASRGGMPYLYFNGRTYDKAAFRASNGENVRPYRSPATGEYIDAEKFQIIDAGLDQKYGEGSSVYPNESMPPEKLDNVTSFSTPSTLAH